jgi:cyanate permease
MTYIKNAVNWVLSREPVLFTAVILAVGNLIGQDLSEVANLVESLILIVAGVFARSQVTPVR